METSAEKMTTGTPLPKETTAIASKPPASNVLKVSDELVKKKKPKPRDIEELKELPVKAMADKEKDNLIKALKEENTGLENKITSLKNNCEKAFERVRDIEDQYNSMERYYLTKLKFIEEQINANHNAILMGIKGGLN
jgi:DNA repair exonuclease SbcCD ATPase subunit